ncbi:MAG: hypothetical protein ED555_11290 [Allomuricauda sp.]|nr:MAG: hypothetical protein ED555_11290 [Allomuricauda sp.]
MIKTNLLKTIVTSALICSIFSCKRARAEDQEIVNDLDSLKVQYEEFINAIAVLENYNKISEDQKLDIYVLDNGTKKNMIAGLYASEDIFVEPVHSDSKEFSMPFLSFSKHVNPVEATSADELKSFMELARVAELTSIESLKSFSDSSNKSFLALPQKSGRETYTNIKLSHVDDSTIAEFGISAVIGNDEAVIQLQEENVALPEMRFNAISNQLWEQIKLNYGDFVSNMTFEETIEKLNSLKNSRIQYVWENDNTVGDIALTIDGKSVDIRENEIEGIDIPLHGKLGCELEIDGGYGNYSFKVSKVYFEDDTEGKIKLDPRKIKSTAEDKPYDTFTIIIEEK